MSPVPLTEEQRRIVAHDHGPALVFAVAGAGKSTAAAHRIERLVRERVFAPREILATTFNRAAARELRDKLHAWPHCAAVPATTLHSVGYRILRRGLQLGHLTHLHLGDAQQTDLNVTIYTRALAQARADGLDLGHGVDRDDFLEYVSRCKGDLQYADLEAADLPPEGLAVARQAQAPTPGSPYLALYQVYERVRRRDGIVTFDDMLLDAWEALVRFPDLLADVQGQHRCVIVDEFQDVNLAQSEIVDLITRTHRNLMAVGDDDQTIYEWRGARVDFILGFAQRYGAATYFIRDNFRSFAPHVVLANRVIEHNTRRQPKRLELTRGFGGETLVHRHASAEEQGRAVVLEIDAALRDGARRSDVAVLVRTYAQTPFVEHFLIEARIPYVVRGNLPFYQRPEVVVLVSYLRLADAERTLRRGAGLDDARLGVAVRDWHRLVNRPTRYVPRAVADEVALRVTRDHLTFARAARLVAAGQNDPLAARLTDLAETLAWLADTLDDAPASVLLDALDRRIGYTRHLLMLSGLPENAEGRVRNVQAFSRYARDKGSGALFLRHLNHISFGRVGGNAADETDVVTLTTVFRAKGSQWPLVFVPDVNAGTYPMGGPDRLEEERRVFYVALTRPQRTLHLHTVVGVPTSPFLLEAGHEAVLADTGRLRAALERDPGAWDATDARAVLTLPARLGLERYLRAWWPSQVDGDHVLGVARRAARLHAATSLLAVQDVLNLTEADAGIWDAFGPGEEPDEADFALVRATATPREAPPPKAVQLTAFAHGQRVYHVKFGTGTVVAVDRDGREENVTVFFDSGTTRTMLARFAQLTDPARI